MALIERKLGDGRNLTVDLHKLPGYVVAKVDGKVVISKGVIGFLPETQTVNGKTYTHSIGQSANCKVGVGLMADEFARCQAAIAEAKKRENASRVLSPMEKGWEFEERSDRDADR